MPKHSAKRWWKGAGEYRPARANSSPGAPYVLTEQLLVLAEFYRAGRNPHGHMKYDEKKVSLSQVPPVYGQLPHGVHRSLAEPRRFGSKGTECDMWLGCTFCEMICPSGP